MASDRTWRRADAGRILAAIAAPSLLSAFVAFMALALVFWASYRADGIWLSLSGELHRKAGTPIAPGGATTLSPAWLGDWLLALLHRTFGDRGVIVAALLATLGAAAIVHRSASAAAGGFSATLAACFAGLLLCANVSVSTVLFSVPLFAITADRALRLSLAADARADGAGTVVASVRGAWSFLPIFAIWANLDLSFVAGLGLLVVHLLASAVPITGADALLFARGNAAPFKAAASAHRQRSYAMGIALVAASIGSMLRPHPIATFLGALGNRDSFELKASLHELPWARVEPLLVPVALFYVALHVMLLLSSRRPRLFGHLLFLFLFGLLALAIPNGITWLAIALAPFSAPHVTSAFTAPFLTIPKMKERTGALVDWLDAPRPIGHHVHVLGIVALILVLFTFARPGTLAWRAVGRMATLERLSETPVEAIDLARARHAKLVVPLGWMPQIAALGAGIEVPLDLRAGGSSKAAQRRVIGWFKGESGAVQEIANAGFNAAILPKSPLARALEQAGWKATPRGDVRLLVKP